MASVEATSTEAKRKERGLEPRHWKTPAKRLFQNESLQQLCNAMAKSDTSTFDKLLAANLDLNEVGEDGLTVLFFAYMEGDFPSFIKLLEKGAKPDFPLNKSLDAIRYFPSPQKGETVLLSACQSHDRSQFFLPSLHHTSDPNQQDDKGRTVLHLAILGLPFGGEKRVREVLDAGVDPLRRDGIGKTAVDYAKQAARELVPLLDNNK